MSKKMDCKSIEEKMKETGEKLLCPASSTEELLSLLDETEKLLASIASSPSPTVISALQPMKTALAAKRMLSHPDDDVRVAVTLCICEISRIIAPDDPCDNIDLLKKFFVRVVESFAKLDDIKSRSFYKRVSILETVAKVRCCVLMLDLECDNLILDMFKHFLQRISLRHKANISCCMETIMSLILKESEEISKDLASCLLWSVKKERMVNLSVSFRLGEKVISNCADKLKPVLKELVGMGAENYSEVVASICQVASGAMEQKDFMALEKNEASSGKRHENLDENIVGKRIKVWWPLDEMFYNGAVVRYNRSDRRHKVIYDDGDTEELVLKDEVWMLLEENYEDTLATVMLKTKKAKASSRKEMQEIPRSSKSAASSKTKELAEAPETMPFFKKNAKEKEVKAKEANIGELSGSKRKRGPEKEKKIKDKEDEKKDKVSGGKEQKKYGESIVGQMIKVWWPDDKA